MDKKMSRAALERENAKLRQELADLDELPHPPKRAGEGVSKLKSVSDIATSLGKKIHTVPPGQGDRGYLDLYLLHKERERLVQETISLKKRRRQLGMKVANIDQKMAEKQEKAEAERTMLPAAAQGRPISAKPRSGKPVIPPKYEYKEAKWHRLTLGY